ncbi:MAG: pyridoxal phosphate-dependent aminotransferase [Candidatus Melainabacteria bacterium]|nr:MAG: pyridoxal phosphate-dependent aminotransferase [Candidatus Melainabacteria bacterium]
MESRSVFKSAGEQEDLSGISRRVAQITVSAIKQMPILASKVPGCVSLGQGIPSPNTPLFIREAVIKALQSDGAVGKYSLQPGIPRLKELIAQDLMRTRNIPQINPETEIFVSCGGMEALATGIATIVDKGDEVILNSPSYSSHIEQILFSEGVPVFVPLDEGAEWTLNIEALRKAITKRTKAIILCSPSNPTGAVFSETQLREIAALILEHNLFVILDETYDFLVYDNQPYFSLMSVPELKNNIIAACSFSKRYCMTGWRVGYMYAPERIIRQVLKVHDAFAICAPTISQYAALAALEGTNGKDGPGDESVRQLMDIMTLRRNLVCERLDRLSEVFTYAKPRGGYYVFPRFKARENIGSMDFALRILNEAKVITVPGNAFGPTGEGHIRMSFGAEEKELTEAFDRIDNWLAANN